MLAPSTCEAELQLQGALDLAGTQAPGAGVNVAGGSINDGLDTPYIGLPGSVGSSVGMGNLDTESHAFSADVALCHESAPPFCCRIFSPAGEPAGKVTLVF